MISGINQGLKTLRRTILVDVVFPVTVQTESNVVAEGRADPITRCIAVSCGRPDEIARRREQAPHHQHYVLKSGNVFSRRLTGPRITRLTRLHFVTPADKDRFVLGVDLAANGCDDGVVAPGPNIIEKARRGSDARIDHRLERQQKPAVAACRSMNVRRYGSVGVRVPVDELFLSGYVLLRKKSLVVIKDAQSGLCFDWLLEDQCGQENELGISHTK